MKKIVECVPNFSEGRNQEVIDAILNEIKNTSGIKIIDATPDKDHNRLDVSYIGESDVVSEAAFNATKKAAELIDMDSHEGEHPRMGATDVIPFIPIMNVSMEECIELAKRVGEKIGNELNIPVYLYEEAATSPERKNLAKVRKGQYECIKDEIETNPERKPDFGPAKMPKAGATAVGARMPLIAFNVNLNTNDLELAKEIAKKIRESSGGLLHVKAMGFDIKEKGIVQVSMNLTNYTVTPIHKAFEEVKKESEERGIEVLNSEIIGLVPLEALSDVASHYLKETEFKKEQVIENRLIE